MCLKNINTAGGGYVIDPVNSRNIFAQMLTPNEAGWATFDFGGIVMKKECGHFINYKLVGFSGHSRS